jgi:hypothetical protein
MAGWYQTDTIASGELAGTRAAHAPGGLDRVELLRSERLAQPLDGVAVLGMTGFGEYLQESGVAVRSTAVLGRTRPRAVET